MSKVSNNEEAIKKAENDLLQADREKAEAQRRYDLVHAEGVIASDSSRKETERRLNTANRAVKINEKKLEKVGGVRIDPTTVPSIKEVHDSSMEEFKKKAEEYMANVVENDPRLAPYKDYEYSALKRAKNESHNLKETISNFSKEVKLDWCGLANPHYLKDGVVGFIDSKGGVRDPEVVEQYMNDLHDNKFKAEPYFTKDDGVIYYLVKKFYESSDDHRVREVWRSHISGFYNTLNRQINDETLHLLEKSEFRSERHGAKQIREAYMTGKEIKICPPHNSPAPVGVKWTRNPLKEAAWIVVHSYMVDRFITEETQLLLIPTESSLVPMWNNYISEMEDIPMDVKKYFYLDEDTNCIFKKARGKVETEEISPEEAVGPTEDDAVPFEDAIVVDVVDNKAVERKSTAQTTTAKTTKSDEEDVAKKNHQMDQDCKAAIERDDARDEAKATAAKKEEYVDHTDSPFKENNTAFEKGVKNLNKFTALVHKNKCYVAYANSQEFPGIVDAMICHQDDPHPFNHLMIDPCIIYGDSLRVVTVGNNQGDIRKEIFVSINQPDLVTKLILRTFTKEDHDKHNENLPRVMNDFRDKYHILERVDLRGCTEKFKNGTMPYQEWRKMIINISNVLKDKSIPVCRFRVVDVESGDKFKLICDYNSMSSFKTSIFNEDSNIAAANAKFWVVFDSNKYKKDGYMTLAKEAEQKIA